MCKWIRHGSLLLLLLFSNAWQPEECLAATTGRSYKTSKLSSPWFSSLYLIDWSLALGLGVGGVLLLERIPLPERDWAAGDRSLLHPYKEFASVSLPLSVGLSLGVPLVGIGLTQLWVRSGHDFHHAMLGLVEAFALTALGTQALQIAAGSLRPDWFERCRPNVETLRCTGNAEVVYEGRRSFPSFQASLAFAGATYLSLYLAGHMKLWDGKGWFWKVPVLLLPLVGAVALSVSPVLEHRHHLRDVVVGGVLGAGFAVLAYHLNFHTLWDKRVGQSRARHRITWSPMLAPSGAGVVVSGRW